MIEAVEIIQNIRAKLSDESRWTKGEFARNARGEVIDRDHPEATCWCLMGAYLSESPGIVVEDGMSLTDIRKQMREIGRVQEVLHRSVYGGSLVEFNDAEATTHDDIMGFLDFAIKQTAENRKADEIVVFEPSTPKE